MPQPLTALRTATRRQRVWAVIILFALVSGVSMAVIATTSMDRHYSVTAGVDAILRSAGAVTVTRLVIDVLSPAGHRIRRWYRSHRKAA